MANSFLDSDSANIRGGRAYFGPYYNCNQRVGRDSQQRSQNIKHPLTIELIPKYIGKVAVGAICVVTSALCNLKGLVKRRVWVLPLATACKYWLCVFVLNGYLDIDYLRVCVHPCMSSLWSSSQASKYNGTGPQLLP